MTTTRHDLSVVDTETFSVRRTIDISAPLEKVWAAVTEPEHVSRWFGQTVLDGAGVGARGTMTFAGHGSIPLEVEAFDPPRRVAYRWGNDDALGSPPPAELDREHSTVFTFTLEEVRRWDPAHRRRDRLRGDLRPARQPRGPPHRLGLRARQARRPARGRSMTATLVPVFAALGDETRWSVLAALGEGDASASALAARLPVSRQAIAKHLASSTTSASSRRSGWAGRSATASSAGSCATPRARLDEIGTTWDRRLAAIKEIAENL